eukprot:UN03772
MNILINFSQCAENTLIFDPSENKNTDKIITAKPSVNINKKLMRRYYLIEKARDANIIGIVVATLAVEYYLAMVNYLKKLIHSRKKKCYIISVDR